MEISVGETAALLGRSHDGEKRVIHADCLGLILPPMGDAEGPADYYLRTTGRDSEGDVLFVHAELVAESALDERLRK